MKKISIWNLFKKKQKNEKGTNTKGDLGKFLIKLRKEKNLIQQDIADLLNVTNQTVCKWEKNQSIPDDGYKYELSKFYKVSLEELYLGTRNINNRKRHKRNIIINGTIIVFLSIILPLFILLSIYFLVNFNSVHVYRINSEDTKSYNQLKFKGMFLETRIKKILYIGNIYLENYDIKDSDIVSIEFFSKNNLIYYSNTNKNIYITFGNDTMFNINDFLVKMTINDNIYYSNVNCSIDPIDDISNSNKLQLKSDEEIIKSLENAGFVKEDNFYILNIKGKVNETKVSVDVESKEILFIQESSSLIKHVSFHYSSSVMDAIIYQKDSIKTVIEKYVYYYNASKLECNVGSCLTTKEVLKTMEKYINLLIVD